MKSLIGLTIVIALTMCIIGSSFAQGTIVVKGSDTMVILGQKWAEMFMKKNPGINISVTGGGSGVGIAAFINGTCDIAQASRAIKKKEVDACKSRGKIPYRTIVALDGLAFAVHSSNPVKKLTIDQIAGIYTGKITNWSQVGGKNAPIVVLSRDNNSGTFSFVKEVLLKGAQFRSDALFQPSTKAIQIEITKNPNAIGYGGEAYFKGKTDVEVLSIAKDAKSPYVEPTLANVQSGKYPVSRPLQMYTAGKPTGNIKKFIDWILTPEGQSIVSQIGYVPLPTK